MNVFKAAVSFLLLSSVSAIADDTVSSSSVSSLPIITAMTSAAKPAVDGVNGKLELSGGASQFYSGLTPISSPFQLSNASQSSWSGGGQAIGTITTPLGHSFGLQVDMGAGALRGDATGTAASHLFWRDPDKGQIGVYGQGNYWALGNGSSSWKAAAELEGFFGNITLRGLFGAQGYGYNYSSTYVQNNWSNYSTNKSLPDRFFNIALARYYVTDDFMIAVGQTFVNGRAAGIARAEWLPSQFRGSAIAPTLFVRSVIAPDNNSSVMAGLRIYLGNSDKTLIRRHREDDPEWEDPQLQKDIAYIKGVQQQLCRSDPRAATCGQ